MELRTPQYWLAEISEHGNPKLIDGSHDSPEGANKAAYLIQAMRLGQPNRRFAVARVELSECVPSGKGVNHEAVRTINAARSTKQAGFDRAVADEKKTLELVDQILARRGVLPLTRT